MRSMGDESFTVGGMAGTVRSEVGVHVVERQPAGDHHHLKVVEELRDLLRRLLVRLELGGHPDLGGLLDDLLADRMDALLDELRGTGGRGVAGGGLLLELGEELLECLRSHDGATLRRGGGRTVNGPGPWTVGWTSTVRDRRSYRVRRWRAAPRRWRRR